jgi:hypothetical protein
MLLAARIWIADGWIIDISTGFAATFGLRHSRKARKNFGLFAYFGK